MGNGVGFVERVWKRLGVAAHRAAHWLHWQSGTVVSGWDDRAQLWIGFKCSTCGKVTSVHTLEFLN